MFLKFGYILILNNVLVLTVNSLPQAGGKCTTSAECVAPNVCSKWGWCQWTKIYGEDGPRYYIIHK